MFLFFLYSIYNLSLPLKGNSHVIFNGSFYYNARDSPKIIKLELKTGTTSGLDVPYIDTSSKNLLYTSNFTYMDFSVDDNGLWVIYGIEDSNNTAVMKVSYEKGFKSTKILFLFLV